MKMKKIDILIRMFVYILVFLSIMSILSGFIISNKIEKSIKEDEEKYMRYNLTKTNVKNIINSIKYTGLTIGIILLLIVFYILFLF
jgi:hypothetical protein